MLRTAEGWRSNVSRETLDDLEVFADLLTKWNARINLVSPNTIPDLWTRHIADSAQVFDLNPNARNWADLGSGGGLPGLVVAILAKERAPELRVVLVESDQRKCAFLRTVIRELSLPAKVEAQRIEAVAPLLADCISARALAPLSVLCNYMVLHGTPDCVGFFPKGERADEEIEAALEAWTFTCQKVPSATSAGSHVLKIGDVRRA